MCVYTYIYVCGPLVGRVKGSFHMCIISPRSHGPYITNQHTKQVVPLTVADVQLIIGPPRGTPLPAGATMYVYEEVDRWGRGGGMACMYVFKEVDGHTEIDSWEATPVRSPHFATHIQTDTSASALPPSSSRPPTPATTKASLGACLLTGLGRCSIHACVVS